MNNLVLPSNEITMNSREIAELTGKQHAHVIRDIRKQFKEIKINESKYGSVYLDKKNEKRVCFKLDYEQTMILLTGYSIPLRAKVVRRWKELEQNNNAPAIPKSYADALQLAADQAKQIEQLSIKSQVADELTNTNGLYLPSVAGKIITGHPNLFCNYLIDEKIMFRRHDKLLPYAKYADRYFKIKVSMFKGRSIEQSYFTPRGLAWIKSRYLKDNNLLNLEYKEN